MADLAVTRSDIEYFASELVDGAVDEMQGSHIDDGDVANPETVPRTTWFAGAIVPVDPGNDINETIRSRVSPSQIGIIGNIEPERNVLTFEVGISFAVYYRTIPSPETYRDTDTDGVPIQFRKRVVGPVRETVSIPADPEATDFDVDVAAAERELETAVADAYEEVYNEILDDPRLYGEADTDAYDRLYERVLESDEVFEEVAAERSFTNDTRFAPDPDVGVTIRLLEASDGDTAPGPGRGGLIRVELENETDIDEDDDHTEEDRGLYEATIELRPAAGSSLNEIEFEELPDNFRYDSRIPGHGYNCTVDETRDGEGIRTVSVPVWRQPYFMHRDLPAEAIPEFERLIDDPVEVLRNIVAEMVTWGRENWTPVLSEKLETAEWGLNDLVAPRLAGEFGTEPELLAAVLDPEREGILASDLPTENSTAEDDGGESLGAVLDGIVAYRDEINQFVTGINLLDRNSTVRDLFVQTNEVFWEKVQPPATADPDTDPEYTSWRAFQIVFIVTQLPDLVAQDREFDGQISPGEHRRNTVSLLHFPTGGGKTEAYLALVVFAALYDRRHGKEFGLTAMMRFPLRLLSLQQFQRVVEVLVYADEKRQEVGYGGQPFSAGYVSGATANRVRQLINQEYGDRLERQTGRPWIRFPNNEDQWEANRDALNWLAIDWENGALETIDTDDYRMVERCPLCGTDIEVRFNPRSARIEHNCPAPEHICDREILHVYVTDQDIYRYIPTMLLGTQDKLAAIGYNLRSRTLAGRVSHYCPEHGYSHRDQCLMTRFCALDGEGEVGSDTNDLEQVTPSRPAPTLTIQDELHLINEDLGTFESHYYSAFEKHLEWACDDQDGSKYIPPKKLAATATIEEYGNQVQHLYQQDATLFPARGPEYRETFYAERDDSRTQRHYVGVVPWNRSQINSIMRLLYRHQAKLQSYLEDPSTKMREAFDFDDLDDPDEFERLVTHYLAMVTYVISRAEGGRVYKSTDNQVNDNLQRDGLQPIDRGQITGGTDFREIQSLLEDFEQLGEPGGVTYDDIDELIVATSSISHGVDLEALNWMCFFNAPPQMSEYIQASSRVGRRYPGIVLDMFDPIKIRDRSHFHYFGKYHEYQDRLVQPVPLNRWAKFSIEYTFPGLFWSLLYVRYFEEIDGALGDSGYFRNRPDRETVARAIERGAIDREQIHEDLVEIYGEDPDTGECPFAERLENMVTVTFARMEGDENIEAAQEAVEGNLMLSLRQVDEQVPIYLTDDDEDALGVL